MININENFTNWLKTQNNADVAANADIPYITLIVAKKKKSYKLSTIDRICEGSEIHPIDVLFTKDQVKEYFDKHFKN